jgi:hypothetical protein
MMGSDTPGNGLAIGEQVRLDRDGRVLVATLDNPPDSLMTARMAAELDDVVRKADGEPSIGAVVMTGAHQEPSSRTTTWLSCCSVGLRQRASSSCGAST